MILIIVHPNINNILLLLLHIIIKVHTLNP